MVCRGRHWYVIFFSGRIRMFDILDQCVVRSKFDPPPTPDHSIASIGPTR